MSDLGKRTLTYIGKNKEVRDILINLLYKKDELTYEDSIFLYSVVHLLIQDYMKNRNKKYVLEYAYYITAKTSFKINDFTAIYDFAINLGFYPLARKIIELGLPLKRSIASIFSNIEIENFKENNKILTFEQKEKFTKVLNSSSKNISFIAPTSYGKSELIIEYVLRNPSMDNIAIIVPTKSLINQVYNDFKGIVELNRKILMHDQNYNPAENNRVLAIVTQERALRLQEKGLTFDILFIDEAHEIMKFDFRRDTSNRSLLLTRLIRISKIKNSNLRVIYLSPVVNEVDNLRYKGQGNIEEYRINRDLKLYELTYLSRNCQSYLYDNFLGEFIELSNFDNALEFIKNKEKNKNLHFLYRPIYIEQYAKKLYEAVSFPDEIDEEINELIKELKELIHPTFKLAKYLEKGILYLHAKLPLIIRNYLIMYINKNETIKHVVANSVILAGMNLPIDNLFYISGYAEVNDLINLMGRVNRLGEIFKDTNENLKKIFIPVNFIELDEFPQAQGGKMLNKIKGLRKKQTDIVRNPLLENAKIENVNKERSEEIVSSENLIITNYDEDDFYTKISKSGAQGLLNYTTQGLKKLKEKIDKSKPIPTEEIMNSLKKIFFKDMVYKEDFLPQNNVRRLQHQETVDYYKNFLNNLKRYPLNVRITNLVDFRKSREGENYQTYVGRSFGEEVHKSQSYDGINEVYINIDKYIDKSNEIYNIALIKLQIDEEYISHEITILLTAMLELNLITEEQFNYVVYGTNMKEELLALEIGLSRNAFLRMKADNQVKNIKFDKYDNPYASRELKDYIFLQQGIYRFELETYFDR